MDTVSKLIQRLNNQTAKIGVVGLGYVGLPLSLRFAEVGYKVVGFDIERAKVRAINDGQSYIKHIGHESVAMGVSRGLEATTDFSRAVEADALIICVPWLQSSRSRSSDPAPDIY
jgi:UDP-N-acetyl-D-glucosamine dehydrogenase